jgi:hypothetical protein
MSFRNNDLLRRDLRLDSLLLRDLRFDRFLLRREFGLGPFLGTPFGASPFWGMWGGGVSGSGVSVIPVGGAGVTTTPAASPGDTADTARAALLLEQAVAERLANRRRAFDELLYERDKTPTPEQELLGRSRDNPPVSEVLSGKALNALLDDLRKLGAGGDSSKLPNALLPLDENGLQHINVTRGAGSVALLKHGGRLNWPDALTGAEFQQPRERLAALATEAVEQAARNGRVDPDTLRQTADEVDQLRTLLRRNIQGVSLPSYIEARHFLQSFDDALVALQQSDVAGHFTGGYALKAQTVRELVKQMTDNGLRFAPATPGDEAAYKMLREALAACDRAAHGG